MEEFELAVGTESFRVRAAGPADGEMVVLLHGFPQTSWSWRHQLDTLASAGYRALAPDQRGYSPGARPADVERYRSPHLVADVLAIADALGGHRFHLVGHDWGAAVAWQVAARYPERLRTLSALSVPHPLAYARARAGEGGSDQTERSGYMKVLAGDGAAELLLADGGAKLRAMFSMTGHTGDVEPYVAALSEPGAMQGALNWYKAIDSSQVDGIGPVIVPTLFVWSTEDTALGREGAEMTADYVEGPYRFEVLDGISHWIPEEAPERLNELLLEHLAARCP